MGFPHFPCQTVSSQGGYPPSLHHATFRDLRKSSHPRVAKPTAAGWTSFALRWGAKLPGSGRLAVKLQWNHVEIDIHVIWSPPPRNQTGMNIYIYMYTDIGGDQIYTDDICMEIVLFVLKHRCILFRGEALIEAGRWFIAFVRHFSLVGCPRFPLMQWLECFTLILQLSSDQNPVNLLYIYIYIYMGDEILPSYIGIIFINQTV